jgi:hypothetical protein
VEGLEARLAGQQVPGGKLIVAVDQRPCPDCAARLRALARRLGLSEIEVWGPTRDSMRGAGTVSPKTAARTATMAGRPPTRPELLMGESLPPAAAPAAPAGAPPVRPTVPPEGEGAAQGRGGGAWEGVGSALFSIGLGIVYSFAHAGAIERRRDAEGYSPAGPLAVADESLLERLGRWMLDPTLDGAVPAEERLNIPVWRRRIRQRVASSAPGDTITFTWQFQDDADPIRSMFPEDIEVTYTKQPDGRWRAGTPSSSPPGFRVPDLNKIVDETVSDAEIHDMLFIHFGTLA